MKKQEEEEKIGEKKRREFDAMTGRITCTFGNGNDGYTRLQNKRRSTKKKKNFDKLL